MYLERAQNSEPIFDQDRLGRIDQVRLGARLAKTVSMTIRTVFFRWLSMLDGFL